METTPFSYSMLIREDRLDTFGHVNNAEYLKMFEEARWELITRQGLGHEEVLRTQVGPIILDLSLRFRREVRLRETVSIETRCTSYRGRIGHLEQTLRGEDDIPSCEAKFTFGLFDMVRRKLVVPTPEWLRAFGVSDASSGKKTPR